MPTAKVYKHKGRYGCFDEYEVTAANIACVGYDAENQTVFVQFPNGSTYAYKGVSKHEFQNLLTAPSVGSYFNRNYKNVYPYECIEKKKYDPSLRQYTV